MSNEILLILSLLLVYGGLIVWFIFFGKKGLYCWTVFATIAANIEVLILINAFGMEQTLGNILFASTFLVTDILSELYSKEDANRAVNIGVMTSITFIIISQSWLLYTPSPNDFMQPAIREIFSNTPRMMLASLAVYAVTQKLDVILYHKWWSLTEKFCGNSDKFLWLRNNGSTLISQFVNTLLFTTGAFLGIYDAATLINVIISSYVIYIFTSILDTPVIYLARKIGRSNIIKDKDKKKLKNK